jgi:hypothetical protein
MKTIILSIFALSLYAAVDVDPHVTITKVQSTDSIYVLSDNVSGTRYLMVPHNGGWNALPLPVLPLDKRAPDVKVLVEKPVSLTNPMKLEDPVTVTETHVNMENRQKQLDDLKAAGWTIISEFNVAGYPKYRLQKSN